MLDSLREAYDERKTHYEIDPATQKRKLKTGDQTTNYQFTGQTSTQQGQPIAQGIGDGVWADAGHRLSPSRAKTEAYSEAYRNGEVAYKNFLWGANNSGYPYNSPQSLLDREINQGFCAGDSDCPGSKRCLVNYCVQCVVSADCGPGATCKGNQCVAPFDPTSSKVPPNSGWEASASASSSSMGAAIWGMPAGTESEAPGSFPDLIPFTALTQGATSTTKEITGSGSSSTGTFATSTKVTATHGGDPCNIQAPPEPPSLTAVGNDPCIECTNTQLPGGCDYDTNTDGLEDNLFDLYEDQPGDLGEQGYDDFDNQDKAATCRFDTDCGTPVSIWGQNPSDPGVFTGNSFNPGCPQQNSPGGDPTGDSGLQDHAITGIAIISDGADLNDGVFKSVPVSNENANGNGAKFNLAVNGGRITQIERASGGTGYTLLDTIIYVSPNELSLARATTNSNGQPNFIQSSKPYAEQSPLRVRITQVNDPSLKCEEGSNAISSIELASSLPCASNAISKTFYKVKATAGSGEGAMVDVTVSGGAVQSINLYCGGKNYTVGDSVTFNMPSACAGGRVTATVIEVQPNPQPWDDKYNCNLVVDYSDPLSDDLGAGTGDVISGDDVNDSGNCCETTPVTANLAGNSSYAKSTSNCRGQVNSAALRHIMRNRGGKYSHLTPGEINQLVLDNSHSSFVVEPRPGGGKQLRLVVEDSYGMAVSEGEYVVPEDQDTPCGGWEGPDCNRRQRECGKINCSDGVCCQQEDLYCCECNANCPRGYLCVKTENGKNECWPECIEDCAKHTIHCLNTENAQYELKARVCCEAHRYLTEADFETEGRICGCPDDWKGVSVGEGKIQGYKWVGGNCYEPIPLVPIEFEPYEPYKGKPESSGSGATFVVAVGGAEDDYPGTAYAVNLVNAGQGYVKDDLLTPKEGTIYQQKEGAILGLEFLDGGTGYRNGGSTWAKLKVTGSTNSVQKIYVDGQYINITPPPSQGDEAWAIISFGCENPTELDAFCTYRRVTSIQLQSPYRGKDYKVNDIVEIDGDWIYQDECRNYGLFNAGGEPVDCEDYQKSRPAKFRVTSVSTCPVRPILAQVTKTDSLSYCAPPCGDTTPFTICNSTRDLELALTSGVAPKGCSDGYKGCCCDPEPDPKNEENGGALKTKECIIGKWNLELEIEECICTDPEDTRDSGCRQSCHQVNPVFFNCDIFDQWYGPIGPLPTQIFVGTFRNAVQYCQCPCAVGFLGGRLCRCYDCKMKPPGFFMDTDGSYDFYMMACFGFFGFDVFVPMKTDNKYISATALQETYLKASTAQAIELADESKKLIPKDRYYSQVEILSDQNNHYQLDIPGEGVWWIFKGHWSIAPTGGNEKDFCDVNRDKLKTGQMSWYEARNRYMAGGKYTTSCQQVFYGLHKTTKITKYDYWSPYGKIPYPPDYCMDDP